ncbi:MAG: hypothetical protein IAE87_03465 [Rhodobacteraceae bacterium]|jgi:hypothetical protein|nr:hypothetical protein [Paracoccaceae bacterium]
MSRYRIDRSDLAFAREFLADPIGYHSPGLQRVLNLMRGSGVAGAGEIPFKYVLVVEDRHGRWRLGRLPLRRGAPVELVEGVVYTDLIAAERDIFSRRWKDLTGDDLDQALSQP